MKITRGKSSGKVTFGSLESGDWFIDEDGDLCVKCEEHDGWNSAYFPIGDDKRQKASLMNYSDNDIITPLPDLEIITNER